MSARQEMDQKIELWIKERLETSPVLIQNYMAMTRKKAATTRKWYLGYLLEYMKYMEDHHIDVMNARPLDVQMYVNYLEDEKNNGHSIINTKLSAIIDFHKFLYKNGFSNSVPCDTAMKFKKEERGDVVYMTEEEMAQSIKDLLENGFNKIRECKFGNNTFVIYLNNLEENKILEYLKLFINQRYSESKQPFIYIFIKKVL